MSLVSLSSSDPSKELPWPIILRKALFTQSPCLEAVDDGVEESRDEVVEKGQLLVLFW